MKPKELKPCPFCGERLIWQKYKYVHSSDTNCLLGRGFHGDDGLCGPIEVFPGSDAECWNRRITK